MTVTIEIRKDELGPALQRLLAYGKDGIGLALADLGEYLVRSTRERAAAEVDPTGSPWAPLSPRYKARKDKRRPGLPMLKHDNHMLGDQFSWQVRGTELLVGTNAIYGALHQFGGTDSMAPGPAAVPARPWLGLSAEDETEALDILEDHIADWLKPPGGASA